MQKSSFECVSCGYQTPQWMGKCPSCGAWNSLEEKIFDKVVTSFGRISFAVAEVKTFTETLNDKKSTDRIQSKLIEFDRVLGGGFVKSQVVLLSGDPGIGKSTLLLNVLLSISAQGYSCIYVSGEESIHQIGDRLSRLTKSKNNEKLTFLSSNDIDFVCSKIEAGNYDVVIFDSLQTIMSNKNTGVLGGVSQLRDTATKIVTFCKAKGSIGVIIGHVNKDGDIAGPKITEHLVDTVLYLEGEENTDYRILRSSKNRFGKTSEIGVFVMTENGILSIGEDENIFVQRREESVSGVAKGVILTGNRPFIIEVQALCDNSDLFNPRRVAKGIGIAKLQIICSIISKYTKFDLKKRDVYINVPYGLKIDDGAMDLAVAMAIISSYINKPLGEDIGVVGELSLTGEIILPSRAETRVNELIERGFKKIYVPKSFKIKKVGKDVKLVKCSSIKELFP